MKAFKRAHFVRNLDDAPREHSDVCDHRSAVLNIDLLNDTTQPGHFPLDHVTAPIDRHREESDDDDECQGY